MPRPPPQLAAQSIRRTHGPCGPPYQDVRPLQREERQASNPDQYFSQCPISARGGRLLRSLTW